MLGLLCSASTGCAASLSCQAPPPRVMADGTVIGNLALANLTCWSRRGEQAAQYRLGQAYENGELGLTPDIRKAKRLYQSAASRRSGTIYVYSPPVGSETSGRVLPVRNGSDQPGVPQAREALQRLKL